MSYIELESREVIALCVAMLEQVANERARARDNCVLKELEYREQSWWYRFKAWVTPLDAPNWIDIEAEFQQPSASCAMGPHWKYRMARLIGRDSARVASRMLAAAKISDWVFVSVDDCHLLTTMTPERY